MKLRKYLDFESIRKAYNKLGRFYRRKISKDFYFNVQLTDHCNLNCVGCSHFSGIATEHFLNVFNYRKDCERFAKLAGNYVYKIQLMGGEPLLHEDIAEIIDITRDNFPKASIRLITNGILLPNMGLDFWNVCKKNNVVISISPYPVNLNVKKIYELALRYSVVIDAGNQYTKKFTKNVYDATGSQNRNDSFKKCGQVFCHQLYEGKFYMCQIPALIKYFNKYFQYNFQVSPDDYIDIYEIEDVRALLKYLKNPIPFCRYCNINASDHNIRWCVSRKEISEWM